MLLLLLLLLFAFWSWSEPRFKTLAAFSAEPPEPLQRVTILNDYDQNKPPLQFPGKINFRKCAAATLCVSVMAELYDYINM